MDSSFETARSPVGRWRTAALVVMIGGAACSSRDAAVGPTHTTDEDCEADQTALATPEIRAQAARPVGWVSPAYRRDRTPVPVKLLGFNDFHGQITATRKVAGRPVGGAAVLASYLEAAEALAPSRTLIVHAGDHVGASPPESALLQDEPAIDFLNGLSNRECRREFKLNPFCNVVGTIGNHELDEGRAELHRLLEGGTYAAGPFLDAPWRGARFPVISSNVVDAKTGAPIAPPFVVKIVNGVPIGFIGAILHDAPSVILPESIKGLRFLDEAETANHYARVLRALGVRSIVLLLHQGGFQTSYAGQTDAGAPAVTGSIVDIVSRLDDEFDLVVSGHTHAFTNTILKTAGGASVLVTQAFSYSTAFTDIDLEIDPVTLDVVSKTARVVTTYGDEGPGLTPDPIAADLVKRATDKVGPIVQRVVGTAAADVSRAASASGESALGDLIADAQRASLGTDVAFMNPGGIRTDVAAGPVTWGALFAVQPFGNTLTRLTLSGQQIVDVLNQQWSTDPNGRFLQVSGLAYTWDGSRAASDRVVGVTVGGKSLDRAASYTVTVNNFLATGGDGFKAFTGGTVDSGGPSDLDALVAYVAALSQPFQAPPGNRIQTVP
jgi:5'-nucleotidase